MVFLSLCLVLGKSLSGVSALITFQLQIILPVTSNLSDTAGCSYQALIDYSFARKYCDPDSTKLLKHMPYFKQPTDINGTISMIKNRHVFKYLAELWPQ